LRIDSIHNIRLQKIRPIPIIPKPPSVRELKRNQERYLRALKQKHHPLGRSMGACVYTTGEWGCGKTLHLTFCAVEDYETFGIPAVSNYEIKIPEFYWLKDIEILKEVRQCNVIIDEIRRYMDSYLSRSQKTRFISNLCADLGKQSCNFRFSDQHYNAAPTRIRANVQCYAYPQYDENSDWVRVYLFWSIWDYLEVNPFFYFGFYAPDYWDYYDTTHKVEDYRMKFKVKRHAYKFLIWASANKLEPNRENMEYWNTVEGLEYSGKEMSAMMTYIKRKLKEEG